MVLTHVKNHGKRFWKELDKYVGNAKKYDKLLKEKNYFLLTDYMRK